MTVTVQAGTASGFASRDAQRYRPRRRQLAARAGATRAWPRAPQSEALAPAAARLGRRDRESDDRQRGIDATDLPQFDVDDFVRRVLAEDLGSGGDVTSEATIAADARFTAEMNCREPIVVAGLDIAIAFFRALDREVRIEQLRRATATRSPAGTVLMRLEGNARAMLAAERSALNTLQHLSGIATLTRRYVDAIDGHRRDPARYAQDDSRACACSTNMRRGWAARRTTACGSMTGC